MLRPRIKEQKSFDSYVTRDISGLEGHTGQLMLDTIIKNGEGAVRERSISDLKAYQVLKKSQKPLPSFAKIQYTDFLPNFITKRKKKQ